MLARMTRAQDATQSQGEVGRIIWTLLSKDGEVRRRCWWGGSSGKQGCDCVWPGRRTSYAGRCEQPALKNDRVWEESLLLSNVPPFSSSSCFFSPSGYEVRLHERNSVYFWLMSESSFFFLIAVSTTLLIPLGNEHVPLLTAWTSTVRLDFCQLVHVTQLRHFFFPHLKRHRSDLQYELRGRRKMCCIRFCQIGFRPFGNVYVNPIWTDRQLRCYVWRDNDLIAQAS